MVVPHYDDLDRLDLCLASLERQTLARDRFDIVVADNASPCGEAAVRARIAGRATLVVCAQRGAGPARNAGVAASTEPLLAFIDSDCVADPAWLANGLAALEGADLIGGRVDVSVRAPGNRSGAEAFEQVFAFDNRHYVQKLGFSVTANLFTRRDVFVAVGGFRTEVAEDLDWCRRAVALGYRIAYAADAAVSHPARADWEELRRKWDRLQREAHATMRERPGGALRWLGRSLGLLPSIVAHAPRVMRSPMLDNRGERARGLAMLVRLRWWRFVDAQRRLLGAKR
ncbi:hypothetical protein ASG29_15595 [Sphingomonas sp. Leaf412]|nr:hypothetical protein ASG29_15595 [Sphingomonas sp. Leaf412]